MAAEQKYPYSSRPHRNRPGAVQAKVALAETEAQLQFFQSILANSPIGIAVLRGHDLTYELVNPAMQAIVPGQPLLGRSFREIFPEVYDEVAHIAEEALATGEAYSAVDVPYRLRRSPEGPLETIYVTFTSVPLRDPSGRYDSLLVLGQETTQQVRERDRNEALSQVVTDLGVGKDSREVVHTALARAMELLGGDDGSLFLFEENGRTMRGTMELTATDRVGATVELDELPHSKRAVETLRPIYVTLLEAVGAERRWLERMGVRGVIAAPMAVDTRRIGLLYVSFRRQDYAPSDNDLTFAATMAARCALAIDRTRDQEERTRLLAESQRRAAELDATISSMPVGVIIYASDGAILRINEAAEHMLGYKQEERKRPMAERLSMLSFQTAEGKPISLEETVTARVLRGQRVQGETMVLRRPDGKTLWVNVSASPIVGADGAVFGAVMAGVDITALHELQEQQTEMMSTISHDLRSPLTPIIGQAMLLQRTLTEKGMEKEAKSVGAIVTNARRMNSMIQDLVDSVRVEAAVFELHKEPTDLCLLLADLCERVGSEEERERLRVDCPYWLPPVSADGERLERAITNLITNAFKYSPPDRPVVLRAERREGEAVVSVIDQGPGIPPEEQPHLFERFRRTEPGRKRGGLGLGLYIARQIVEAHGGRIWVESKPGQGSTFSLALPME